MNGTPLQQTRPRHDSRPCLLFLPIISFCMRHVLWHDAWEERRDVCTLVGEQRDACTLVVGQDDA